MAQHSTARHDTAARHGTARHGTAQHSTAQHSTEPLSTAGTAQHSTERNRRTYIVRFYCVLLPFKKAAERSGAERILIARVVACSTKENKKLPPAAHFLVLPTACCLRTAPGPVGLLIF